jgi:hypothetical protein
MSRLETQINQIFYQPADNPQVSLILTDQALSANSHLFLIANLVKIQKKTESSELAKISDIIVKTFTENKKLAGENLFETSLAAINQSLADLAHGGKKSWIGKFSALVVLKSANNIYLANTGQTQAMLYRSQEFLEILAAEKSGLHPLKTFSNFTAGKLKSGDVLLLTTSNLFSYVALQNLNNMMADDEAAAVAEKVSKILKDTAGNEGFASFFVNLIPASESKPIEAEPTMPVVAAVTPVIANPIKKLSDIKTEKPTEPTIIKPTPLAAPPEIVEEPQTPVYAPMPAKSTAVISAAKPGFLSRMSKISLPKMSLPKPKMSFSFWQHLSGWAKFFFVSFIIFLLLFGANLIAYSLRKHKKLTVDTSANYIAAVSKDLSDTESALIYRNQDQAVSLLAKAQQDLNILKNVNQNAYNQYLPKYQDLMNRVNHITVVTNPLVVVTLKHPATNLARAGKGFVVADASSGTISTYNISKDDSTGKDLFLLNKIGTIKGLVFIPNVGPVVITDSEMYIVNTTLSQFDLLHIYPKTQLDLLHFVNPDRLYTLDRSVNQVDRIQFSKTQQNAPTSLIKGSVDLSQVTDMGTDTNVYLLSKTDLVRYFNGSLDSNFHIVQPTDQITSANKLFIANNIYVVESSKKRVLVYNKQGALVTQMFFPNSTDIRDIYVDEAARNMFLLDSNRILSITF